VKRVVETYKMTMTACVDPGAPGRPQPLERVEKLFKASDSDRAEWQNRGLSLIGKGAVAFLLLAGGQGTRLGTSDPKGCYDIGLPSHKSLFQLMAERLRRVAELSKEASATPGEKRMCSESATIPWYVMTSPQTDEATQSFFREHSFFGLDERDIFFFQQGTLPCLSLDGKILLETPCTVTSAPDGNGGIYRFPGHLLAALPYVMSVAQLSSERSTPTSLPSDSCDDGQSASEVGRAGRHAEARGGRGALFIS